MSVAEPEKSYFPSCHSLLGTAWPPNWNSDIKSHLCQDTKEEKKKGGKDYVD